jgi:transcriptional regulator with XRE-family HTH domain
MQRRIIIPDSIMRAKRKQLGITMLFMSEKLGISYMTLMRWETGLVVPKREYWPLLRAAYGLYIYELFPEYFRCEDGR